MGNVSYNGTDIEYDDRYSFKNYVNRLARDIEDGAVVYSSSFYAETPDHKAFRDDMSNVTFINCNLDNCIIPDGNVTIDCSVNRFMSNPDDGLDWIVDENNNFVRAL